jgi:hypothetical protein
MNTQSSPARAGALTIAMRAVASGGPKVLRIGKVQGGRVIEERVMKPRAQVTIGASPRCTFVVDAPERTLFEHVAGQTVLHVREDMRGRVALASGVSEIAPGRVTLDESSRGKIVIGDTTFLFQFVTPPPPQAPAQLPIAVSDLGARIDWGFAMIAAFSFLAHFGFAGAVNSDWFDPVLDDGVETASLIEQAKDRPNVRTEERVEVSPEGKGEPQTSKSEPKEGKPATGPGKPGAQAKSAGDKPVALSDELDSIGLKALGSFDGSAPAQSSILEPGSTSADSALDGLANKSSGVDTSDHLKIGGGNSGPIGPGGADKGLAGAFNGTKTSSNTVASIDTSKEPKVPTTTTPGHAQGSSNVPDADSVIAKNRWRFKGCYDRVVVVDPNAAGTVRVTVRIGEGGEVTSATTSGDAPAALSECVQKAFTAMKFAPPEGGSAQIAVPIVFALKK